MRSSEEILKLVLDKATADNRIRAVLLNGSRVNRKVKPDGFQDFDIMYIVTGIDTFIADHNWVSVFGDRVMMQLPDEMTFEEEIENKESAASFHYLMLFKDGNRIDLILFDLTKFNEFELDSLTVVLLDKDNLFPNIAPASASDYLIKKPTKKEFLDTCNEFWWVSSYVAKGLCRDQVTYAKEMMEAVVRKMFMKMIEWHIGVETNFSVSFGKAGKFMKDHIPQALYSSMLATYPDHAIDNIWCSLFIMTELFSELATATAASLHFTNNVEDEKNMAAYLKQCRDRQW